MLERLKIYITCNMYNGTLNANMSQKSLIQLVLEQNNMIERFKKSINSLLESYTIKGNVFGIRQGNPYEFQSGYFVIESESDNLQDAIREMKNINSCIRIVENKFQIGSVHNYITECDTDKKVIDIENQTEVIR